jgi:hypothetical protein
MLSSHLMPSSALPLAYYATAFCSLTAACLVLVVDPSIPGASFYQPRVVALVHLLTVGWLTASILGTFYIVGPLVLRVSMTVRKCDWMAFGAFVFGAAGMIAHFWIHRYDGMAWSALFVTGAIAWVGSRVVRGLGGPALPSGVRLHVVLAFVNVVAAAVIGMTIGFDRSRGFLAVSPLALMFAHAHIAAVGWAAMLVVGLSYRLIPMLLPAAMPAGRSLALSAILMQGGLVVLAVCVTIQRGPVWFGALMIVGGVAAFAAHVRAMTRRRVPRAAALPARDWSVWQIHTAFGWLLVAAVSGGVLGIGAPEASRVAVMWMYGVAGLLGFLAQIVTGMQGRLLPLYAWYRAWAAHGAPPARAANALPSARYARPIFLCWTAGVPLLFCGLPTANHAAIRLGGLCLLAGLGVQAAYLVYVLRAARGSAIHPPSLRARGDRG